MRNYVRGIVATAVLVAAAGVAGPGPGHAVVATPGSPVTWGSNPYGQLGDGSTEDRFSAGAVGLDDVIDIAAGRGHAVALRSDGTVVAWGSNTFGQLGDGTFQDRSVPTTVPGLTGIIDVATGHYHSLALHADGTVSAWGYNVYGQAGDGSTEHRSAPVSVVGLTTVVSVAGGRDMSFALTDGGTVWAWGDNAYGQLGDGTRVDRLSPVEVDGAADADAIIAGAHHSLALRPDGTIAAWGRNNRGQLGDGTMQLRVAPVTVGAIDSAVAIGSGRDHGIAILGNGSLVAWGWNDFGQVGDGTDITRTTPVTVPGVGDVVAVHGGQDYSIALVETAAADVTPPSRPGRPTGVSASAGTIDVMWSASTDDVFGVLTYTVIRDGDPVGSVASASSASVSFRDGGLTAGTVHSYQVVATDGAGNTSAASQTSAPIREIRPFLSDGFDSGDLGAWHRTRRLSIDASSGGAAPPSARAAVKNRKAFARFTLPETAAAVCSTAHVRLESIGEHGVTLLGVRSGAGQSVARVIVKPNGKLVVRSDAASLRQKTGAALGAGWVEIELCVDVDGGELTLARNGIVVHTWDVALGEAPVGVFQLGDSKRRTFTAGFDDVVVDHDD